MGGVARTALGIALGVAAGCHLVSGITDLEVVLDVGTAGGTAAASGAGVGSGGAAGSSGPLSGTGGEAGGASTGGGAMTSSGAGGAGGSAGGGAEGGGAEKSENGAPCASAASCASGFCADGVCCSAACTAACDSCDLSGTVGTCKPRGDGATGEPPCSGGYLCDGASSACPTSCAGDADCAAGHHCTAASTCAADKPNGTACFLGNECQSGVCADGVCCASACTGLCRACSMSKTGKPNGTCDFVAYGLDPDDECGALQCDGAGACECTTIGNKPVGDCCNGSGECQNSLCFDGFCCQEPCGALCRACSKDKTGAADGTCAFVTAGTDPDNECFGASTCNGSGLCTM
jgi:hypothetical protein